MTDTNLFTYWMRRQGLSNSKAAKALGVNISTVKRLKRGKLPMTHERQLAMSAVAENIEPYTTDYQPHLVTLKSQA